MLRIFGADGGTVFEGAGSADGGTIELRPGDGPERSFTLREDDDARIEATNFRVKGVWPRGEEIPFFETEGS